MNRRPNWEIVLRGLQAGQEIKINGYNFAWVNDRLCTVLDVYKSLEAQIPDEVWYQESDISLNIFIQWCKRLTEEEIVGIAASTTIEKMKDE